MSVGAVLTARGLRCAIGRRTVLGEVELTVGAGEVFGVVGPNGAGKSTLLRHLAGLRTPAAGAVRLDGVPLDAMRARDRARAIAFVAQEEEPSAELTVGELVALGRTPHRAPWSGGGADERAAIAAALSAVDLDGTEHRTVTSLSGGEHRRALLARGLAQDTPLLLLDEPTNHLDVRHQFDLLERLRGLGRTVVLSLHDLALAHQFCDQIAVLAAGGIDAVGPPTDVLTPARIERVFGVAAAVVMHPVSGRPHLLLDRPTAVAPLIPSHEKGAR